MKKADLIKLINECLGEHMDRPGDTLPPVEAKKALDWYSSLKPDEQTSIKAEFEQEKAKGNNENWEDWVHNAFILHANKTPSPSSTIRKDELMELIREAVQEVEMEMDEDVVDEHRGASKFKNPDPEKYMPSPSIAGKYNAETAKKIGALPTVDDTGKLVHGRYWIPKDTEVAAKISRPENRYVKRIVETPRFQEAIKRTERITKQPYVFKGIVNYILIDPATEKPTTKALTFKEHQGDPFLILDLVLKKTHMQKFDEPVALGKYVHNEKLQDLFECDFKGRFNDVFFYPKLEKEEGEEISSEPIEKPEAEPEDIAAFEKGEEPEGEEELTEAEVPEKEFTPPEAKEKFTPISLRATDALKRALADINSMMGLAKLPSDVAGIATDDEPEDIDVEREIDPTFRRAQKNLPGDEMDWVSGELGRYDELKKVLKPIISEMVNEIKKN